MDDFGNEMFRPKNFLGINYFFDLSLWQAFENVVSGGLERGTNRVFLTRPTTGENLKFSANLVPELLESFEKIKS
jgi:hypothetical protein